MYWLRFYGLTKEFAGFHGILVSVSKSRGVQVGFGQLDSLHVVLFLDKHESVLEELLYCHFGLLECRGSFP
ncbi:hypothetical protein HanPSC8_Chr07g0300891 [Helianthus annuus]|nr:hypothetical protein HanPSC8_Chr07g0300891 [Helianthus annuus]